MQSHDSCVQRDASSSITLLPTGKSAGEKLCLVSNLYFSSKPG